MTYDLNIYIYIFFLAEKYKLKRYPVACHPRGRSEIPYGFDIQFTSLLFLFITERYLFIYMTPVKKISKVK